MLGVVVAFIKPKIIILTLANLTTACIIGCWLCTVVFAAKAYQVLVIQAQPTIPEISQHLHWDDERLDKMDDSIGKRFDKLEEERNDRAGKSDQHYQGLSDKMDKLDHDMAFIYGGGTIGTSLIVLLITLGVVKINKAEKKMQQEAMETALSADDLQMLAMFARELKDPRHQRKDFDWNR